MNAAKRKNEPGDLQRYHVPNLERALRIMEFLAEQAEGCGLSLIAEKLEFPKNSVFRIVSTLHAYGYVERDEVGKTYRLSRKLLDLGYAAIDESNLVEKSLDVMRRLRDETGETALIATLTQGRGIVLEQVPGLHPVKVVVEVGHSFPLHCAAPAKAMVAFLPEPERKSHLDTMSFPRFTKRTITSKQAMREELEQVVSLGYAVDHAEELEDLHCVAAPVLNHRNYPVASIWVTGPSYRLRAADFAKIGPLVAARAGEISARLGHQSIRLA
ncbi:HTH-type transcriptional repressor AllR [Planctomycetes bacterium Pan216]|uniref:HTH-type transcriptional repressor AllR n=1 Tax=Kolteria novifilia TaxID=2527975 RepID=A0A518AX63_9BACT|nr:HTH-type transcriptional repressor AllR [Planctomycetes bacterium Pan216]